MVELAQKGLRELHQAQQQALADAAATDAARPAK